MTDYQMQLHRGGFLKQQRTMSDTDISGRCRFRHVDLCTGLGGWTAPFQDAPEWRSVGLDIRDDLAADVVADVRRLPLTRCRPDLLTMSPPCTEFTRWMLPWLDEPSPDMSLVNACLEAVEWLRPSFWVLENSRGLHQYWKPARTRYGAFYLWGDFPPFDASQTWKGKMQTSGVNPEKRAEIPYALADSLRRAVEWNACAVGTGSSHQ